MVVATPMQPVAASILCLVGLRLLVLVQLALRTQKLRRLATTYRYKKYEAKKPGPSKNNQIITLVKQRLWKEQLKKWDTQVFTAGLP